MSLKTLRDLINTRAYADYPKDGGAWNLDPEVLSQALYDGAVFSVNHAQAEAFFAQERLVSYDLNVEMDTDTVIGLRLIELNETPVGITWSSGRKMTTVMEFIDADGRDFLRARWEAHAPDQGAGPLMSTRLLDTPIAAPGAPSYAFWRQDEPALSADGAYAALRDLGDLDSVEDLGLLDALRASFQDLTDHNVAQRAQLESLMSGDLSHITPDLLITLTADVNTEFARMDAQNAKIQTDALDPITARIDALRDQNALQR